MVKKVPPSEKDLRALAKKTLGENAQIDYFWRGRIFVRNEEDISIELESTSNAEARRLLKPILEAVGKARRTGRKS